MNIEICSRDEMERRIGAGLPEKVAVISFANPKEFSRGEKPRIRYDGVCDRVFYVTIPDIDIGILDKYGYTSKSYLAEANELAEFVYKAVSDGYSIICQCDYGQSRSAACAAAILQHFEGRGIDIFADYRYYPNQLVYHKVFDALNKYNEGKENS